MTPLKTIAAAVLLSALTATPVLAQAAIGEPGAYSFYHPDRDVLNGGALTPAARLAAEPSAPSQAYAAIVSLRHVQHHHVHHAGR
jgi:hypothetical protein